MSDDKVVPMFKAGFKKLEEDAILPTRATKGSAGYDLHALHGGEILPGQRLLVKTGIGWDMYEGLVGIIKPRSSLAVKFGIDTMAGVIDSDYKGDIGVVLHNTDEQSFMFGPGDRIAQLVLLQYMNFTADDVEQDREGGFGSTGE